MKSDPIHHSSFDLQTFFEKFDLFADAPNAVAKMRELVLELAVQGKLVEQERRKESLTEAQRHGENAIENVPFVIPKTWRWTTLDHLGDTKPRNDAPDSAKSSFVPMTLIPAEYGQSARYEERTWGEIKKGYTHFQDGDVVMAKITPCFENGKSAIMNGLTGGFGAGTTELHVFRRNGDEVLPEFVILYLKTRGFINRGISRMTGSAGQKRVPSDYFAKSPFPLPPLAEQRRIVAKVDELMALCDRLEAQQQERETQKAALARAALARFADAPTPANLERLFYPSPPCLRASVRKKENVAHRGTETQSSASFLVSPSDLRKSILTLAVQGKLVPQDPNDEPAERFLETIAKQRAKLLNSDSLRKTKPCRQFTSDEVPNKIPETWAWTMLGEVTDIGTGSTPSRTETSFWIDGTIPWIASGSTSRSPITEGDERVTAAAVKAHRLRIYQPGTLLLALYGQGKTRGQVAVLGIAATINQACAAICPLDGIPSMQGYLRLLLKKQYDEMRSLSAGGAQPNLNVQKIKEILVPIPPLAEQRRIVAKVEQLMALVDALETQLNASRAVGEKLLTALVAELTNGKESRSV